MIEKCYNCHKEFEDIPREEELTVNVKSKEIKIKGIIHRCPHCGETYNTSDEALEICKRFDEECKKQGIE